MALADTLKLPKTASFLSGQGAPKTPKGYVGVPEISPVQQELTEAQTKAEKDVGMADVGLERAKEAQQIKELESQTAFAEKTAREAKELPERDVLKAKRKEMSEMAFVPSKETAQDIAGLFSLINVIGMAIGGGGKQGAQRAMYAMNGMLEGHQKGRADLYKKEKDEFDKNFKVMQEAVKTLEKDYEEALKMYQYDKEAGDMARKLALAKSGSPLFKAMEDRIGMIATLNSIKDLRKSVDTGVTLQNNLQKAADDRADKASREAADRQLKKDMSQLTLSQKVGTAGPRYNIYQSTGKLLPSDKEAMAVQSTSTALREINSLRERLKDTEIQTGLRSYPAPFIQKLKSLVGQNLSENEVRQFAEENLTGNDKTTLFIKDAILTGFKVEQGLTGTRVPVFTQKVVGPILDPRNYTPETYDKLLATREKDLYNTGEDYGFSKDEIKRIARVDSGTTADAAPAAKQMPSGDKLKAYAATHFNGDEESAKQYLKSQGYQ